MRAYCDQSVRRNRAIFSIISPQFVLNLGWHTLQPVTAKIVTTFESIEMSSAVTFSQDSAPMGGKTQPVVIYLVSSDSDSSDVGSDSDSEPKRRRMHSAEHRNRNRTMSTPVTDSSPSPTRVDYMLPKDEDKVICLSSSDDDEPPRAKSPSPPPSAQIYRRLSDWFSDDESISPPSPSPSPPPRDKSYAERRRAAIIAAFGSDCSSDDESISPPSPSQSPPRDLSPANGDHAVESEESDDETIADMQRKAQKRTADTGSAAIMPKPKRPRRTGPKSITANTIVTFVAKHYTEKNGIYQLGEGIELDAIRKFMRKACKLYSSTTFCIEVDTVFTVGGQKAKTAAQLHKMMVSNRHTPGERGKAMIFFHGTNKEAGMAILEHGFDIRRETRSLHGPGAYATPDAGTAHIYANEKSGYGNKYWMLILIKHAWNITVAPSGIKSFPPDVDCFCEPGPNPKIYSFDPAHNTHLTYALVSYTVH